MPFKKGQSGNPGGRPKVAKEVKEAASRAAPKAIKRLAELMESEDKRIALQACDLLLSRAVGKPTQALEIDDSREAKSPDELRSEVIRLANELGVSNVVPLKTGTED